jgi:hypothetical protein
MRTWDQKIHDQKRLPNTPEQVSFGMHRKCELDLLAIVTSNLAGLVIIGCGRGHEFLNIRAKGLTGYNFKMLGIDRITLPPTEFPYWQSNILTVPETFNPDLLTALQQWRDNTEDSVLFYTDNGHKITELNALRPILRPNDIIGTHDFGTEVPLTYDPGPDFAYLTAYDEYINNNFCMQGFWVKNV